MKNDSSIINTENLNKIYDYLVFDENKYSLKFKLKNFKNEVVVHLFSFPFSFPNESFKTDFKKFNFKNSYDLLNTYLNQYDEEITEEEIKNEEVFDYIEIGFDTIPEPKYKGLLNTQSHYFRFFLYFIDEKVTDFRLICTASPYFSTVENFANSKRINLDNIEEETQKTGIDYLEKVFYGICQKLNFEISKEIDTSKFENLIIKAPDLDSFINFLALSTQHNYADSSYKKDAKRLQKLFEKGYDEYKYSEKFRNILAEYYMTDDNDVILFDSFFNSDWKFDSGDAIAIVESITGNQFSFNYPEETYSHELFPYIQTALAEKN